MVKYLRYTNSIFLHAGNNTLVKGVFLNSALETVGVAPTGRTLFRHISPGVCFFYGGIILKETVCCFFGHHDATDEIKDKLLDLIVYDSFKSFDNILIHELLHIYQYVKNKIDYDNQGYNKELYQLVGIILNNEDKNYSDIEKTFASALYLTFPYE